MSRAGGGGIVDGMRSFLAVWVFGLSVSCKAPVASAPVASEAVEAGTLVATAPMARSRAAHTATALADGRVLVAGGMGEMASASAELYDPVSGRFGATGAMGTPRHSHTATVLSDGRVWLAGGYDAAGRYLASAEVFDPATGRFSPMGGLTVARAGHVAVRLGDGRVLVVGGVGEGWSFLASAEVFDPATGRSAATGAMGEARESHVAVRLSGGDVLIVGGHRGRRAEMVVSRSIERYAVATGAFVRAGEMTVRRHKHDAVVLGDGRVLIVGGADERDRAGQYRSAEIFDPRTGRSARTGDLTVARYKLAGTTVRLADGRWLVAGGAARAEVYDARAGVFTGVGGSDDMGGLFSAVARLPDGGVLVTGGYGGGVRPEARAWRYRR